MNDRLRKIDSLIADKVMGWRHFKGPQPGTLFTGAPNPEAGKMFEPDSWHAVSGAQVWDGFFRPTEDIAAAWEVVEKLNSEDFWFNLSTCDDGTFTANFSGDSCREYSPSAPLVICLAALKAKGVKPPP